MGLVGGVLGFCLGLPIGLAAAYFVYLRYFAAARRLQVRACVHTVTTVVYPGTAALH